MSSSDKWLSSYDGCARLGQDIMEKITERNRQQKGSSSYTKLSSEIRGLMRQFSSELNSLRQTLIRDGTGYQITQREVERRQLMMDQLSTKERQLDEAYRNDRPEMGGRSALLDQGPLGFGGSPWGAVDTEDTAGLGIDQIRGQQQMIIREQDDGLEALSNVISRQKQMAVDIGNEVDQQNDLLDDITDHVDRTDQRLLQETRHIKIVDRKSNTCIMWVIIVLLFIAVVVIAAVPFHH